MVTVVFLCALLQEDWYTKASVGRYAVAVRSEAGNGASGFAQRLMSPLFFAQKTAQKAARLEAARQHLARKAYRGVTYNKLANGKPVAKQDLVYRGVPYNFG